jgi:hypothetical protein
LNGITPISILLNFSPIEFEDAGIEVGLFSYGRDGGQDASIYTPAYMTTHKFTGKERDRENSLKNLKLHRFFFPILTDTSMSALVFCVVPCSRSRSKIHVPSSGEPSNLHVHNVHRHQVFQLGALRGIQDEEPFAGTGVQGETVRQKSREGDGN